jgi:hypothetical protein
MSGPPASPAFEANFKAQGAPTTNVPVQNAPTGTVPFFAGLLRDNTVNTGNKPIQQAPQQ